MHTPKPFQTNNLPKDSNIERKFKKKYTQKYKAIKRKIEHPKVELILRTNITSDAPLAPSL